MRNLFLFIILIILLVIGGYLFYTLFIEPGLNTNNSIPNANQNGISNDITNGGNSSNGEGTDNNGNGADNNANGVTNNGTDNNTNNQNNSGTLPETALISDEVDQILIGLGFITVAAIALYSGFAYKYSRLISAKLFGLDLTNYDENSHSPFVKLKQRLYFREHN